MFLKHRIQVLQGHALPGPRRQSITLTGIPLVGNLPGNPVILYHQQIVAGARNPIQTLHLNGSGRTCFFHIITVFIHHAPHPTIGVTSNNGITNPQRATLHNDGRHGTTTTIQVGFDSHTLSIHVRVSPQIQRSIGGQQDGLQQPIHIDVLLSRNIDKHGVTTIFFWHQTILGQLATDLLRGRAGLINLIDRNHDRHVGSLGMVDGFHGLRHHTIVGGNHQHRNVGGFCTTSTHGGKCLVTRGIQESNLTFCVVNVHLHLICANTLSDATGLAGTNIGFTDGVQKAGFTVVDVTHDGHHRRAGRQVFFRTGVLTELQVEGFQQFPVFIFGGNDLNHVVHFLTEQHEGFFRHGGRCGHHFTQVKQSLHQCSSLGIDFFRKIRQRSTPRQSDCCAFTVG